ncbi:MAG: DNA polymerase III subunit alpha [Deltaproteobacteria bacterium]|nr:DNA polymerase III subunit alpha [Deltaproteobacteria bacterium]
MSQFTHLHLHTQYSFLDGAIKIKELMKKIKEKGMNAVAITDHGNLHGVVEFYETAKNNGIKPIIGCELYINPTGPYTEKKRESERNHILLLAKNLEGYKNLIYLVSKAHLEGFYYVPRIDKKILKEHSKGLIGASACLAGEINTLISNKKIKEAEEKALEYKSIFESGHFFIEIMRTGLPEQDSNNPILIDIARKNNIPLLATNDCHYLEREDAKAHDILLCIQTDSVVENTDRLHHNTDQYYIRSPKEMIDLFSDIPDAIENTTRISEMVDLELELNKPMLPDYKVPEGYTKETYLEKLAREGLKKRLKQIKPVVSEREYFDRLEYELKIINEKGFAGYFLIVQDFINYAKNNNIPVGPGRGSGAGSLVAFSIGITELDPLRYGLLFERFLNPERKSLPDIDTDFCKDKREKVINYVREKYGDDRVCQIITFSELKAKSIIKDVARVLSIPFAEINAITKSLPNRVGEDELTVDMAVELEPKLRKNKELIDISRKLEGLNRQTGLHAAGIVISDRPLIEVAPLTFAKNTLKQSEYDLEGEKDKEEKEVVIQFMKDDAEKAGLVKFDFLGLKTLTVINNTVELIRKYEEDHKDFDINNIPIDDPSVYRLLSEGDTNGVFQCESAGFKSMLKRLKPQRIEELIAALALYRPGPLDAGLVDQYINRKNGLEKVSYPHKKVEHILKETYGIIVYQEQVMNICVELCGWTMGKADSIRKAMGKKDRETMQRLSNEFINNAISVSKMKESDARHLWEQIEKFAGYAFNKSHSAAYAIISYQTAYLRTHFYKYFMCAALSSEMGNTEKISEYLMDLKRKGVKILLPDINCSNEDFSIDKDGIRIGLLCIKGIGKSLAEEIIKERKNCNYRGFYDFVKRIKPNRKALESLVYAGALDFTGIPRPVIAANIDRVLKHVNSNEKKRGDLLKLSFDCGEEAEFVFENEGINIPDAQLLKLEKDVIGFYVSKNPILQFISDIRKHTKTTLAEIQTLADGSEVVVGGMILKTNIKLGRNKERFALIFIEDDTGSVVCYLSTKVFEEHREVLDTEYPVIINGTVSVIETDSEGEVKRLVRINVREIKPLNEVKTKEVKQISLEIPITKFDHKKIFDLHKVLSLFKGETSVNINFINDSGKRVCLSLPEEFKVSFTEQFENSIRKISDSVTIKRT